LTLVYASAYRCRHAHQLLEAMERIGYGNSDLIAALHSARQRAVVPTAAVIQKGAGERMVAAER